MNRPYYKPDPVGGPEQYVGAEYKLNEPWEEQDRKSTRLNSSH